MDENVFIEYRNYDVSLSFDVNKKEFTASNMEDVMRYLKGVFTNKERFMSRFIDKMLIPSRDEDAEIAELFTITDSIERMIDLYDKVEPFSYEEAFKIESQEFAAMVFGSIDITEMIAELGHERIATAGKPVKRKSFSESGEFLGMVENDNIYEVHKVNLSKLNLEESAYALKCWCTTTNKEHWLWIEEEYKDDPLAAVASTFRLPKDMIPHVKELKRQGDIMIVEMKEGYETCESLSETVPLTADQYFDLLTAET